MELTKLENTVVGPVFLTNSQMKLPAASRRGIQKIRIKRHNQKNWAVGFARRSGFTFLNYAVKN